VPQRAQKKGASHAIPLLIGAFESIRRGVGPVGRDRPKWVPGIAKGPFLALPPVSPFDLVAEALRLGKGRCAIVVVSAGTDPRRVLRGGKHVFSGVGFLGCTKGHRPPGAPWCPLQVLDLLVGRVGIEPTTFGLKARCSAS
jgi:hypothetical protein